MWISASLCENDRIRVKAEVRTGLLCHAVRVKKRTSIQEDRAKSEKGRAVQGCEKEVAARVVNKQRAKAGETESRSGRKKKSARRRRR